MAQQQKLARRDYQQQPLATEENNSKLLTESTGIGNFGEKRKHQVLDFESDDDDDFAGFDDDATSSENGILSPPRSSNSNAKKPSLSASPCEENSSHSTLDKQEDMESTASCGHTGLGPVLFDLNKGALMAASVKRKVVPPVNAQDEAFRIPFKYGWKRELVYRANMDGNSKDKGEVYYITPAGKKLRTRNDIVMALHDGLTMDNFTFIKDPVGGSPDEEIIRSAKSYGSTPRRSTNSSQATMQTSAPLEIPIENNSLGKRIPKPKMPKGASPPHASSYGSVPVGRVPSQGGVSGFKPNENAFSVTKPPKFKNKVDTCTIQCLPAMGMIPQLQCTSCLCMYHPECVEVTTAEALARRFTCKICLEEQSAVPNADGFASTLGKLGGSMAQLQPLATHSMNNTSAIVDKQKKQTPPQPPPKIGPGTPKTNIKEPPPQDVIVVGGHQFIVVPKGKVSTNKNKKPINKPNQSQPPHVQSAQPEVTQQPQPAASTAQTEPAMLEESRKSLTNSRALSSSSQQMQSASSNGNSRSFIAADLAAIRSESGTNAGSLTNNAAGNNAGQRSLSSVVAGLEQNRLFASNFFSNVSIGYDVLQQTFQYLKVQELLRASCVCRMWNQVANHPRLWRTVRMKNSHVNDWAGLASTLRNNGTKHLDLRKMLISGNSDEMWQNFIDNIEQVDRLERIDLCRCSSTIVGSLLKSNPYLKVINALAIKNDPIDFANFEHGQHLQELRLKSSAPVSVDGDLAQLGHLQSLRHLSLTSILKLGSTSIEALGNLKNLESLELGECTEIGQNLASTMTSLTNLQRLRLEKGQENFNMFTVLDGISQLPKLTQLELINCDVKVGFDKQIHKCRNIKKLLLIPTYVSQSAATNHMVLSGVAKLCDTLETFIWTVTVELLRVTELYIDQCDTKNREDKNSPGESIPILKPVPGAEDASPTNSTVSSDTPAQVEIVPLTTVTNILDRSLPKTKLKILKIPFASTWKQGMI
ncbi:uncharacterized protein LOC129744313 isoform X2 [Uranotaenia lowii]|uniref:uncharacterized protein LOC129744313 isoform X2 n=1 Tax=Uranotaenia lowii TaxID=190385 RepID=UPI00247B1F79|nr:uncharacterized protein LOC129744313 isoform X2 [Uranotaenia lowii]